MSERFPEVKGRGFEFALKKTGEGRVKAYESAKLPEYSTRGSAAADFFCAERVEIPSIWDSVKEYEKAINGHQSYTVRPTMVHTGIKSFMEEDEVLHLYNRSSNPGKRGLVLANSVGVVDSDYYGNPDNDGEIMFAFYNFNPFPIVIEVGEKIGQGEFTKFLRPTIGCNVKDESRVGGFGSTGRE